MWRSLHCRATPKSAKSLCSAATALCRRRFSLNRHAPLRSAPTATCTCLVATIATFRCVRACVALLSQVQVISKQGKPLHKVGGCGIEPGRFLAPEAIAFDHQSQLIVTDSRTHRVQIFHPNGELLTRFGYAGTDIVFDAPTAVCVDTEGRILVGNANGRIKVLAFV